MPSAPKILFLILFMIFGFLLTPATIYAQTPTSAPTAAPSVVPSSEPTPNTEEECPKDANGIPLDSKCFDYIANGQTTMWGSIGQSIICGAAGLPVLGRCIGYTAVDGKVTPLVFSHMTEGGALAGMGSMVIAMYSQPPTSSGLYLATIGQNMGIIPTPAYAQVSGSGSNILLPVFKIWQVTRNLAYVFFVFIFIAIGFMIMFRQKINPQTVISIQSALPSLVIGLILVTFSYFIAALLVDIMFVCIQLVTEIFISSKANNTLGNEAGLKTLAQDANLIQLFGSSTKGFGTVFSGVGDQFNTSLGLSNSVGTVTTGGVVIGALMGGVAPLLIGAVTGVSLTNIVIPVLVILVLLIALVFQMFRLLFLLVAAYIQILVLCIAGPFYILIGTIPGRGETTAKWWKGILANTLIFPAVFAAFLFAGVILGADTTFNKTLPLFGGASSDFIKALLAYGIILGTPAIPKIVKDAFKAEGGSPFVPMAVSGVTGGTQMARSGYNRLWRGPRDSQGRGNEPGLIKGMLTRRDQLPRDAV